MNRVAAFFLLIFMIGCAWDSRPGRTQEDNTLYNTKGKANATDLVFICGKAGMAVDFVTKNCTKPDGSQVNPYSLYPPFQSPLGKPDPSESIMRCEGRAVDFVTGRCM
jgi:hypothetical protein